MEDPTKLNTEITHEELVYCMPRWMFYFVMLGWVLFLGTIIVEFTLLMFKEGIL